MLHLKKIMPSEKEYMESDFYVPIKVKFENWDYRDYKDGRHVYLGIGSNCLLELGFCIKTGIIGAITLVSLPKINLLKQQKNSYDCIEKKGLPLFITKRWKEDDYYLKEPRNFNVYLEENNLTIELLQHEITLKVINERFVFCFDKDNLLCAIEFRNMTEGELALLNERYGENIQRD